MTFDSPFLDGAIGALGSAILAAIGGFVAWGRIHASHEALDARVKVIEGQLGVLSDIRSDVSYIRGYMDAEQRVKAR